MQAGPKVSGSQGVKVSRSQGLRVSGSQDLRVSGSQSLSPRFPEVWIREMEGSRGLDLRDQPMKID